MAPQNRESWSVRRFRQLRSLAYRTLGPVDALFRRLNRLERYPPIHLRRHVGCLGDVSGAGPEFVVYLKLLAGLQPDHRLWDVGCGCGFLELALEEAGWTGSLVGTDIHRPSIDWARRTIGRRLPSFRFIHADIHHPAYWPKGSSTARDWLARFDERDFDLVIAKSLCTHLLPGELDLYLEAISGRLRATGRAMLTFFILNADQERMKRLNRIAFTRVEGESAYAVRHLAVPTAAVAYDETYLRERFRRFGLMVREPIHFGYWTGRPDGCSFQDVVIANRCA